MFFSRIFLLALLVGLASAALFDTSCPTKHYTREGLYRAEPFKGENLGWFNCTGTYSVHDPATADLLYYVNLPPFPLSTLYEESCGCWVTVNGITPFVVHEYGNELRGAALQGTCFENELTWPGQSQPTTIVGYTKNIDLLHRDIPFLNPATGDLVAHQTFYHQANGNEIVVIRQFDPVTGVSVIMQNLICVKYASQP